MKTFEQYTGFNINEYDIKFNFVDKHYDMHKGLYFFNNKRLVFYIIENILIEKNEYKGDIYEYVKIYFNIINRRNMLEVGENIINKNFYEDI